MNISNLKQLEVVNLYDGRILGNITDFIVNLTEGRIEAIIIPGNNKIKILFNNNNNEYIIPWSQIKKIGEEVILVAHNNEIAIEE